MQRNLCWEFTPSSPRVMVTDEQDDCGYLGEHPLDSGVTLTYI
jgi:hypothetical protein